MPLPTRKSPDRSGCPPAPRAARDIEEAILETALSLDDPASLDAFLEQTFTANPEGKARMHDLLKAASCSVEFFIEAHEQRSAVAGDILDEIPHGEAESAAPEAPAGVGAGARIGPYRLIERIGEGGCGVVYEAEQTEPLRRRVALKVIRRGMDSEAVIARFQAERQTLALMDHPCISQVLDAGTTPGGRPFFVMERVDGQRITDYCDSRRLDIPARLALFLDVCDAIQHAHLKGVIHRDIKPSNILVGERDGTPCPKVIDFGIAKATRGRLAHTPEFTARDQFIGTPAYTSPEQVDFRGVDVDTRSDVYSLGALLYELLAGRPPFDSEALLASGMVAMRRTLLEQLPPPPSAAVPGLDPELRAEVARRRQLDPQRIHSLLRGDLDWIVAMALEKDRNRRYQTVGALAADIRRFLDCQPVVARPPSRRYLFGRFVRRNRVACLSALAVVVSLAIGLGTAVHMFLRERDALREQQRLTRVNERMAAGEQRMRRQAERMQIEETRLRQQAAARQAVSQAAVLWALARTEEVGNQFPDFPPGILEPTPEEAILFQSLGAWNAGCDRWPEALWCFNLSMKGEPPPNLNAHLVNLDWPKSGPAILMACPVTLMTGNRAEYDALRRTLLSRLGKASRITDTEHILRTSLLTPADAALLANLDPLAQRLAAALESGNLPLEGEPVHWFRTTLALFEYRCGNDERSVTLANLVITSGQRRPERDSLAHCIAALASLRQSNATDATAHLAAAKDIVDRAYRFEGKRPNRPVDRKWFDWTVTRILLKETEAEFATVERVSQPVPRPPEHSPSNG